MTLPIIVPLEVMESEVIVPMTIETDTEHIPLDVATEIVIRAEGDYYEGSYEITPSETQQILPVRELTMRENLTINPIPNNYGLITWNGYTLTVS